MVLLEQNKVNEAILTLREKTTLVVPFYLFVFTSTDTKEEKIFTASETSTKLERFNSFNIELTSGVEDLLSGVVKLPFKGFYDYIIYSQESETNLDLANITEEVERGKVYVDDNVAKPKTVYNGETRTKTVYNG